MERLTGRGRGRGFFFWDFWVKKRAFSFLHSFFSKKKSQKKKINRETNMEMTSSSEKGSEVAKGAATATPPMHPKASPPLSASSRREPACELPPLPRRPTPPPSPAGSLRSVYLGANAVDIASSACSDLDWDRLPITGEFDMHTPFSPAYQFTAPAVGHVPPMFTGCCDLQQRQRAWFHAQNVARLLLSWGTLTTLLLAEGATALCLHYGGDVQLHPAIFITVLVFPLAFSINATYQRRERALDDLAILKSSSVAWFLLHQEWAAKLVDPKLCELPERKLKRHTERLKQHNIAYGKWHLEHTYTTLQVLFKEISVYLSTTDTQYAIDSDMPGKQGRVAGRNEMLRRISYAFKEVSFANERLRMASLAAAKTNLGYFPVQAPILTRPIHWTFFMLQAWEKLRGIREYRSPTSIRSFTKILTFTVPSLMAPYWAYLGELNGHWSAYYACAFMAVCSFKEEESGQRFPLVLVFLNLLESIWAFIWVSRR